ncbi:MAG: DMT family transporter [Bryobacterales bacterium]|nr:DMT family transporter [Bryobacterales bacterium]
MAGDSWQSNLHQASGRWRLGLGLSLTTMLLWGTLPVALRSLLATMSPLTLTFYRYLVSATLISLALVFTKRLPARARLQSLTALLAAAIAGFVGNHVFFLLGLAHVGPTGSQVVMQLAPVLLIVAGAAVFGDPFGWPQWLGVGLLTSGMTMFFHHGLAAALTSRGVWLLVLAAALWVGYAMAQKQLLRDLPSPAIMWVAYCSGVLLLAPAASPREVLRLDTMGMVLLIYCCVNSLVAYAAFAEAMAHWEVSRVSAVLAATPLFTPVFAGLAAWLWPFRFRAEGLDGIQIAGGALVAAGSALAASARKTK